MRCLCVVCALSVRCLCAVCAPSVLRGADLKFAKRARAPALRHDASRTYRGADSFPSFLLHPYRSVGPNTPIFPTFFPPMRYIAQRYTGQSSRVPLFQKMGKLCAALPPPLLSDDEAPPVFNFPVGPEIHFSVPTRERVEKSVALKSLQINFSVRTEKNVDVIILDVGSKQRMVKLVDSKNSMQKCAIYIFPQ